MKIKEDIDWNKFIGRHDLIWDEIPKNFFEAPFLGNGFMGASFYFNEDNTVMQIALGHTCIYDNRQNIDYKTDTNITTSRLPIGKINIKFRGVVTNVKMRLDLFNARLFGLIVTTKGTVEFDSLILNDTDSLIIEHTEHGDEECTFEYEPSLGISPRQYSLLKSGEANRTQDYQYPQQSYARKINDTTIFVQPYFNGGGFSVAYNYNDNKLIVSVDRAEDDKELPEQSAEHNIKTMETIGDLLQSHFKWWHSYYKKSFISIDSGMYEGFIYIQLYKLACASRENGRPFDTCGPWLTEDTRWPGTWWNLNVELAVSPLYVTNHIDIAKCLSNTLKNGMNELINNVPVEFRADCAAIGRSTTSSLYSPVAEPGDLSKDPSYREAGNLVWALYYCYEEYRMTGDKRVLNDVVYPLLKRAVQFYLYALYEGEDGRYHLNATVSPEYPKSNSDDVNYDLALLRWGCKKLIEICDILGIEDERKADWESVLNNLVSYPISPEEGFKIAANTSYEESHRHYSHLLMFYPLHEININNIKTRELVEKSIDYWQSKREAMQGYSLTGAASMKAMLGDGDKALANLQKLWNGYIHPNTMYDEGGNPVLETPPSAVTSIMDMLIQSYDGIINIFPAVPSKWKNVCFDHLLCFDGFEVGAKLENGEISWIKIKSNCGKKCIIRADFHDKKIYSDGEYMNISDDMYLINIDLGEEVILSTVQEPTLEPEIIFKDTVNYFGLNSRNTAIR